MKLLLASLLVLSLTYFYTDRQLFFYGKSDFEIYNPFSIPVKPDYWGYDLGNIGFVLVDDFDFIIVGPGNKYKSSEIIVNEVIKYGFDQKKIVAIVSDSLEHKHFLRLQSKGDSEVEISVDTKNESDELTWIEIKGKESYVKTLVWIRSIVRIGLFILVVIVGFRSVRLLVRGISD